jgi:flagellar hook assembly protein FlgD
VLIYGCLGIIDDIVLSTNDVQVTPIGHASTAQAFPNPFPDRTTITISPTESGTARVSVVNQLGQEVAKLYDGNLSAGQHSFTWDASGVAAGTYECLIRLNGQVETVPVVKF